MNRALTTILIGGLLAACTGEPAPAPTAPETPTEQPAASMPAKVLKAVELARALKAKPDNAEAILKENGMTKADLDALMFEIAADAKLSAAYTSALAQ